MDKSDIRAAPAAPLPPDYIDHEHQGDDREMLETFYGACSAEGGTVDEITLRGIKAVLAARPAAPAAPEAQRDAVIAAVTEALGHAYDCLRVWEAWSVGTMDQDDFALVAEDSDRVAEIADAAIEAMRPAALPAPEGGEVAELVAWLQSMRELAGDHNPEEQRRYDRAAAMLQQQESRIADLRAALRECGRAVGSLIQVNCSDSFLLQIPNEVQLAVAAPAPAVVPVAYDAYSEGPLSDFADGGMPLG